MNKRVVHHLVFEKDRSTLHRNMPFAFLFLPFSLDFIPYLDAFVEVLVYLASNGVSLEIMNTL